MKTRSIARGIVGSVAALLGVMAAGCSAETGEPEAAEIGSTSQAIAKADISAFGTAVPAAHEFGAYCTIVDPTGSSTGTPRTWLLAAGGVVSSGTLSHVAHLLDPSAGTPWITGATDATLINFKHAAAIVDPQNADTCVVLGGELSNGTKVDKVVTFKISNSGAPNRTPVLTVQQSGKLSAARSKLQAVACDSEILAIGGDDGSAFDVLDVWSPALVNTTTTMAVLKNNASPTPQTVTLAAGRYDHGATVRADATSTKDGIVIGGGFDGTNPMDSIEVLRTVGGSSCKFDNTSNSPVTATLFSGNVRLGAAGGSDPRSQLPAFYDAANTRFVFPGGYTGSTASSTEDRLTVTWTANPPTGSVSTNASALGTAVASPLFVPFTTSRFFMIGGADTKRETGNPINHVQEYNSGTWTDATQHSDNSSLTARLGAFGGVIGSQVYFGSGISNAETTMGGPTYLTSVDQLF